LKRRRTRTSWVALSTVALRIVLTTPAFADSYDSAIARGVAARDRALETGSVEDWQQALDLFAEAVDLKPTKEAKFEFAGVAVRLHLEDEAFAAYEEALGLGLQGRAEERARAFVEAHGLEVARLDVAGPAGTMVYVGSRRRAVLPLSRPLVVSAGALLVRLEPPGSRPWEAKISIEAGKTTSLKPELAAPPDLGPGIGHFEPSKSHPVDARPSADTVAGYIAFVSAGSLVATGVVAWAVRERNIGIYNDDSLCLVRPETRGQQCGGYVDDANIALGVEIAAFAAAGFSAALGTWWLLKPNAPPSPGTSLWCSPSIALGWRCGGAF
jgi:hypothetical protein